MIYGGDTMLPMPVIDLYDKSIMLMSIAAARDMYEKGQKRLEDFNAKYGDFMSPIQKDMEWYDRNVTGKVRDTINNLYANGIDPLRSAEGRAAVALLIYQMPTGLIAQLRQSAEAAKEYLKSFDDSTNPELERFLGRDLSNWSTLDNGVWSTSKPSTYQTIDELIEPIVKNVDYTYDEGMTKARNDGNNYYSITRDRLMLAVNDNMADILATPSGAFHWDLAKKAAAAQGGGEYMARAIFDNMIGNRLSDHERIKFEADPFKLDDYRTRNDIRAHSAKAAIDYKYKHLDDEKQKILSGYNIPEDVYVTSLSKAAGVEYLPLGGVNPNQLQQMIKEATKRQNAAIQNTHNVLTATGMFISPEKIAGLIQSTGKSGDRYFLSPSFFKNLHTLLDIRTSYKGWMRKGSTLEQSRNIRNLNIQLTKDIIEAVRIGEEKGLKLLVDLVADKNNNNTYGMVGEDGRWHTYALVRVYMHDGKQTQDAGGTRTANGKVVHDISKNGTLMGLEVGLLSNVNTGTPDFSISARENLGFYGFDKTKQEIGMDGNSGFPYGTNILQHQWQY